MSNKKFVLMFMTISGTFAIVMSISAALFTPTPPVKVATVCTCPEAPKPEVKAEEPKQRIHFELVK